jgi:hypothetical protein
MVNSFWDLVESSIVEIENILDARYPPTSETIPGQETFFERFCLRDLSKHHDAELAAMMEYACLKVIWFHRVGSKIDSKDSIKMAHHLHDLPRWSAEHSAFKEGVIEVREVNNTQYFANSLTCMSSGSDSLAIDDDAVYAMQHIYPFDLSYHLPRLSRLGQQRPKTSQACAECS